MNCSQVVFLDAEASVITHSAIMRGGFQKKTQFVFFLVTPVSGRMYVRQAFFIFLKNKVSLHLQTFSVTSRAQCGADNATEI